MPLGDLHLRWTGTDEGDIDVGDEFDEPMGSPDDQPTPDPANLHLAEHSPSIEPESTDLDGTDPEGTDD